MSNTADGGLRERRAGSSKGLSYEELSIGELRDEIKKRGLSYKSKRKIDLVRAVVTSPTAHCNLVYLLYVVLNVIRFVMNTLYYVTFYYDQYVPPSHILYNMLMYVRT